MVCSEDAKAKTTVECVRCVCDFFSLSEDSMVRQRRVAPSAVNRVHNEEIQILGV